MTWEIDDMVEQEHRKGFRKGLFEGFPRGYSEVVSKFYCQNAEKETELLLRRAVAEGMLEGGLIILIGLVRDGVLSESDAAERLDLELEEFTRRASSKHFDGI